MPTQPRPATLAHYTTETGERRQVLAQRLAGGATLVLDRRMHAQEADIRLVGRIEPDEPEQNAALLARLYIADIPRRGRCQRLLALDDLEPEEPEEEQPLDLERELTLPDGRRLALRMLDEGWRWVLLDAPGTPTPITLHHAIGAMGQYEPLLGMTAAVIARGGAQCKCLRSELHRLQSRHFVLAKRARDLALRAMHEQGVTYCELARRLGLAPSDTTAVRRLLGERSYDGRGVSPWAKHSSLVRVLRALHVDPVEAGL